MADASPETICVVDGAKRRRHESFMLGTKELLEALDKRGISQADMARALGLPSPRISEMYAGKRQVKLDEAKRLVEAFGLDEREKPAPQVSEQTARLLALHAANRLRPSAMADEDTVQELALDFLAFLRFVGSQPGSPSPDAVMGFLEGRRSDRAPTPATRAQRPNR